MCAQSKIFSLDHLLKPGTPVFQEVNRVLTRSSSWNYYYFLFTQILLLWQLIKMIIFSGLLRITRGGLLAYRNTPSPWLEDWSERRLSRFLVKSNPLAVSLSFICFPWLKFDKLAECPTSVIFWRCFDDRETEWTYLRPFTGPKKEKKKKKKRQRRNPSMQTY